jgi:hypothetical protein
VRTPAFLVMVLLGGCSQLLGIENPKPADDAGTGSDVGPPPDVTTVSTDQLTISPTDFKLAQGQRVPVRVTLVRQDKTTQDVTASATLMSDVPAIATSGGAGLIDGGSTAGVATITASLGNAMPGTVKATVTGVLCHPVINELTTGTAASGSNEWVEIYNPCTTTIDVATWTLIYRSAGTAGLSDQSPALATLTGSMAPGTFRLYSATGYPGPTDDDLNKWSGTLQQTDGAVGLRAGPKDVGPLKDSVAYGGVDAANTFIEGSSTMPMGNGKSARRLFDGNDTDNNATDFVINTTLTPRAPNVP